MSWALASIGRATLVNLMSAFSDMVTLHPVCASARPPKKCCSFVPSPHPLHPALSFCSSVGQTFGADHGGAPAQGPSGGAGLGFAQCFPRSA